MRVLALLVGGTLALVLTGSAAALLTPGRTLPAPAPAIVLGRGTRLGE